MFAKFMNIAILLAAMTAGASAHGALTQVTGANGVTAAGFGIDASTPRDGARATPFQQDTSVIRNNEIKSGKTGACGRTKIGGNNDIVAQLEAASSAGLPSAAADGSVTMTIHQVNQDGAGPYTCDVSADGTGQNFVAMQVTKNVPGIAGLSLATAKDFQLVAQMPAGTTCTGGPGGDACIVRCRNNAAAGPFGGCAAVTNAGAGAGTAAAAGGAAAGAGSTAAKAATQGGNNAAAAGTATTQKGGAGGLLAGLFNRRSSYKTSIVHKKRYVRSRVVRRAGWM